MILVPSLRLPARSIPHSMRQEEVLGEEVLCKIVKGDIFGTETVGGGDAADAGEFMHIL